MVLGGDVAGKASRRSCAHRGGRYRFTSAAPSYDLDDGDELRRASSG